MCEDRILDETAIATKKGLPIIVIKRRKYYVDVEENEFIRVRAPHEVIPFHSLRGSWMRQRAWICFRDCGGSDHWLRDPYRKEWSFP